MKTKDFTKPTHKMVTSSKKNMAVCSISVVIPTYLRENVLLDTINFIINLEISPAEIIIVDQTTEHKQDVQSRLENLNKEGIIRWVRLERPSIPHAMNIGLLQAKSEIVLFVDDDVAPEGNLIADHYKAHKDERIGLVAGRVIQPWDIEGKPKTKGAFSFFSNKKQCVTEFIGCNFSVRRSLALEIGGFDENFVHVAYRYERDFSERVIAAGYRILFEPKACVRHLHNEIGGTRSYGDYKRTIRPSHSVGEYYYILRKKRLTDKVIGVTERASKAVSTRYHLSHPWWIPCTLTAELMGFGWASYLAIRGPRYLGWDKQL